MRAMTSCAFVMTSGLVAGVVASSEAPDGLRENVAAALDAVVKDTVIGRLEAGPVPSAQASAPVPMMAVSVAIRKDTMTAIPPRMHGSCGARTTQPDIGTRPIER